MAREAKCSLFQRPGNSPYVGMSSPKILGNSISGYALMLRFMPNGPTTTQWHYYQHYYRHRLNSSQPVSDRGFEELARRSLSGTNASSFLSFRSLTRSTVHKINRPAPPAQRLLLIALFLFSFDCFFSFVLLLFYFHPWASLRTASSRSATKTYPLIIIKKSEFH